MSDKKALVVIDMQNDFLWDRRKPMFSYDVQSLTEKVNDAARRVKAGGGDVIYIKHILPDLPTNRLFIGFSIKGSEGAELFGGLDLVSDMVFEKNLSDTYTARAFREHMKVMKYSEVQLCGLDLCGCVGKTALGAVKHGDKAVLLTDCVGTRFDSVRSDRMKERLRTAGVEFR